MNLRKRLTLVALLFVGFVLLGCCVNALVGDDASQSKKGVYEALKEEVRHIAEDLNIIKKEILEDQQEIKERIKTQPFGQASELREAAGIPKAHETVHDVRSKDAIPTCFFVSKPLLNSSFLPLGILQLAGTVGVEKVAGGPTGVLKGAAKKVFTSFQD